jgi:chromosomal replication initiator protein
MAAVLVHRDCRVHGAPRRHARPGARATWQGYGRARTRANHGNEGRAAVSPTRHVDLGISPELAPTESTGSETLVSGAITRKSPVISRFRPVVGSCYRAAPASAQPACPHLWTTVWTPDDAERPHSATGTRPARVVSTRAAVLVSEDRVSDQQQVWTAVAQLLRAQLTESVWFSTFAEVAPIVDEVDRSLVIQVPSTLARDRILTRYHPLILDALVEIGEGDRRFDVVISTPEPVSPTLLELAELPETPPTSRDDRSAHADGDGIDVAGLNPRYTFETFVKGASNQFALAAALRVAETPARSYNPLFIYGSAGLGKTHLLHAIGHYVHHNYQHHVVRYVSTETFMNEYVDAIRSNSMGGLRRKYREIDVLLIDDVQFLEGKEGLQEEFFHTFNSLHGANKQIVISSDRMPDAIQTLEERLRGRFKWGLITDIQPPDVETRLAILRNKAERERVGVPAEVLEFIASKISTNIRELEGALIRVTAYASLSGAPITIELAQQQLADLLTESEPKPRTDAELLAEIASILGFEVEALKGKSRQRPLVTARQIAMYVFREQTDLSYPSIARLFGGRDHTTVIHAVEKIARQMGERKQIYEQVTDVLQRLKL